MFKETVPLSRYLILIPRKVCSVPVLIGKPGKRFPIFATIYFRTLANRSYHRKAIYGMIESALLWYDLFVSVLKDMGFILNPYDMCVANKTINGELCTVA